MLHQRDANGSGRKTVAGLAALALAAGTAWGGSPVRIGAWAEGPALAVARDGDLAVISSGRTLRTFDVRIPSSPAELGSLVLPGIVVDLEVSDGIVYAASLATGISVVDVRDPATPLLLPGGVDLAPYGASAVTLDGPDNLAFVLTPWDGDLVVYELGPADRLVELWRLAPSQSNRINAVAVHDDLVFVLESDALRIFHEVPHEASELGAGALASWAGPGNLAVHGGRAYVGYNYMDWEWGLEVLDATDPTRPVSTGVVRGAGSVSGMTVDRDRGLLVSCGPDVYLTSLADPAGPLLVGTYDGTDRRSVDAALDDRIVITAAGGDGAHLVDVTDPAAPAAVAVIPSAGGADRVDWHGDTLLVDLGRNGVQILDAADPGGPAEVACLPAIPEGTSAWRTHLAADGIVLQSARVVTPPDGDQQVSGVIRSLDATDPTTPVVLDRLELDDVSATALADGVLLVATYRSLLVVDIADPTALSVVGSVANGASYVTPMDRDLVLTVAGDGITNRLDVVDLSDPARPSVVGSLDLPDHTRITAVTPGPWSTVTVAVGAGTAASDRFVAVVDLADPSAPEILGRLTLGGEPTAMTGLRGERVAVAVESRWPSGGRALIVDVSDPTRLRVADSFTEVAWIRDLAARDGLLAVAAGDAGVTVWDVSGLLPAPHRPPGAVD